ncbi:Acetyl esterase/lipase [Burkholderia sp. OK233]|nr:Acetyl esterase/lipase [Burkholderia sp. OK233]
MAERILHLEEQMPLPTMAAQRYASTVLAWAQHAPKQLPWERNVRYGPHRQQTYDVFYPHNAGCAPVVIFWHGGGWTNGYKEWNWFMAEHVTRLGAVLVLPDYRLAPEYRMPAAFDDCLLLLRSLAASQTFQGDMRNVYVAGHSAGGHLAALTALRFKNYRGVEDSDIAIRGCAPISGIMDLSHPKPEPESLEARVYDMVLARADDDGIFSPVCWTVGNNLSFALNYGEYDSPRVIRSNRRLAALLACQSAPVACHVEKGRDHFDTHLMLRDPHNHWYRALEGMMKGDPL